VRTKDEVECNVPPFQANSQVEVAHGQRSLIEEQAKLVGPRYFVSTGDLTSGRLDLEGIQ